MISFSVQTDEALRHMRDAADAAYKMDGAVLNLGWEYSNFIYDYAPKDTTRMAQGVSKIETNISASGLTVGVGPFSAIGAPTDEAPRGQIASFIAANPSLRGRPPETPRGAWWTLAKAGKEKLKSERTGSKPAYWQAIQEQRVPTQDGGILSTIPFISMANHAIQSYIRRIENLLR